MILCRGVGDLGYGIMEHVVVLKFILMGNGRAKNSIKEGQF